uniref:Uncharacterized protein n=1 Tax=Globisporangium ultimum (strain ATCC 200006 / CBS 805.95 / DAOM BR144) TaxID=431595 RepID=K3WFV9_GLOUD
MEILSPNAESGEDESSNDSGFEGALRSPETQRQHGRNQKKANSTAASHSPKDEQVNVPLNPNTKARKMALDSLMYSMSANSQRNSKLLDQDTAKEIIVKKYLEASNPRTGSPSHAKGFQTDKKTSLLQGLPEPNRINTGLHNSHAPLPLRVDLQRRMEVVLGALKMRPKAKLDLVLKYTHADHYDSFQVAVVLWEQALHYITKREVAMASLRKFELVASDPRRHFRSLSTHRLKEQKERDALFYQLNYTSDVCREALTELEKQCGDKVYYEDRLSGCG